MTLIVIVILTCNKNKWGSKYGGSVFKRLIVRFIDNVKKTKQVKRGLLKMLKSRNNGQLEMKTK